VQGHFDSKTNVPVNCLTILCVVTFKNLHALSWFFFVSRFLVIRFFHFYFPPGRVNESANQNSQKKRPIRRVCSFIFIPFIPKKKTFKKSLKIEMRRDFRRGLFFFLSSNGSMTFFFNYFLHPIVLDFKNSRLVFRNKCYY
jgi:hypothetical protein